MLAAPDVVFGRPIDVIQDDQVQPAVFVVVEPAGAGGPAAFIGNSRLCGDVAKRSVAIVMVQNGASVAGDVKIRIAVVVVIRDRDSLAVMPFPAYAGLLRHVGEGAVSVVVVQR